MPEKNFTDQHHDRDEAELERLEANLYDDHDEPNERPSSAGGKFTAWIVAAAIVAAVGLIAIIFIWSRSGGEKTEVAVTAEKKEEGHKEEGHSEGEEGREVKLEPEALEAAELEVETVTQRPAVALLEVTGTIESNPQQTQTVSPLVGGRVERMNAAVGDYVRKGELIAVVASPQIAQMHGKMHEAETALGIAERNYQRVQRAENRVAILQSKARLDEAEATLKRTRRLIELGAGAGKDLIAAETNYRSAKADYDFQTNIPLNKEIQEARAAVETARVDLRHIRDEMRSLGVGLYEHDADNHSRDTSLISVYAPAAGMVTERPVNPGAGIEAGTTLFILSNLSSVFAVANVPEAQMTLLRIGSVAEIRAPALGEGAVNGRVSYIDPRLNEDTRTGKVRLEVPNPNARLSAGMFVEIGFQTGTGGATGEELVVNSEAVQRIGDKTVVFIPKEDEAGAFEVREIETGGEVGEYTRVVSGLKIGDKVVTKGSFTLKTAMQKGELGDDDH